jgi:hypothetical protein
VIYFVLWENLFVCFDDIYLVLDLSFFFRQCVTYLGGKVENKL